MTKETQEVSDKPMEVGIKLNNILTFLVLGVMSWVGYNIDNMKTSINEIKTTTQLQAKDLVHVEEKIDKHLRDHKFNEGTTFFGQPRR